MPLLQCPLAEFLMTLRNQQHQMFVSFVPGCIRSSGANEARHDIDTAGQAGYC